MPDFDKARITVSNIVQANIQLNGIIQPTPLQFNANLSERYGANIYLKREDLQVVRSYKIRGAYNFMSKLTDEERGRGVVCASAGNHAQGVAYSCSLLNIKGSVFMPAPTPRQKIRRVRQLGRQMVSVSLIGDTFDDAHAHAMEYAEKHNMTVVPPFDHPLIIEGQGTIALEMLNQSEVAIDFLFLPVGGGGLASGIGTCFRELSANTQIIGVQPEGAPSMLRSFGAGKVVRLDKIDTFVDGAAVKQPGKLTFGICRKVLDKMVAVPEGKICTFILNLYNDDAIVAEPAGALSVAALDLYADQIKGKNVVCLLSGGNNDIQRMPEIRERSQMYEGLKHYFIIRFPQRAGALREFLDKVLGPDDDITYFEYTKKNSRQSGPALVGIELRKREDYDRLIERMNRHVPDFTIVNEDPNLYAFLV